MDMSSEAENEEEKRRLADEPVDGERKEEERSGGWEECEENGEGVNSLSHGKKEGREESFDGGDNLEGSSSDPQAAPHGE